MDSVARTDAFPVGTSATIRKTITPEMVLAFAEVSGDFNPVHLDSEYAATTRFKKPIVHGPLIGSYIGALVATELPGPGTLYVRQELRFLAPVFVGDEVEIRLDVKEIIDKHRLFLQITCTSTERTVIEGEVVVYI